MDADTRFSKAHGYLEFPLKQMAIDFLRTLAQTTGAQLFARDKDNPNNPGAQVFIIAVAKAIYKRSVYALIAGPPASFYEWMGDGMKVLDETVKNTIDMDMEGVARTRPFNEDIVWVVQFVSVAIEARYKVVVPKSQWVVLKCDYDVVKQKFSAHLILHGFKWPTVAARRTFMNSIGLVEEFAKRCPEAASPDKVIDAGVFGPKMLRLCKSTKLGKTLPLWGAQLDGLMPQPDDTFEFFQKSMGSYTVDCQLLESLDGPPIKALPKVRKTVASKSSSPVCGASSSTIERYAPPVEDLRRVVMGLDKKKRAAKHTRDLWTKLGWAIVNIGRVGGYEEEAIEIFREFSMTHEEAFQEPAFRKVVEDARHDSNLLGWTYIEECHLEDTTVFLDSMSVKDVTAGTSVSEARAVTDEAGSSDDTRTTEQPDFSVIKSYAIVKRDFETDFFKLKHPVRVVQVTPDETYYMRLAEVRENEGILTYDEVVEDKGVKKVAEKRFFERWWNDKNRRTYDKVDFLPPPLQCPAGVYNLFRGFRAETLPPINEEVDLEPIFSLMCRLTNEGSKPVEARVGFEYLLNWLAHIVQLPGELPRTAILIQSPQGAGKNVFSSFFGEKVLGESLYLSSAKIDTFFDKFANGLSEKVLCNFNEVKLSLTKSKQDEIKEAITEKKVALEKKGVDRIFVRNCARHLWFSNRMMPIVIEDTDRRWVAFQADSTISDPDYFTELVSWAEDDVNARAFFDFLKARDISNWNALRDRSRTEYYTELQQMSLSRVDQWLIREIEIKSMPDHWLSATSLAERFNQWQIRFAGPNPNAVSNCYLNPKLKPYFNKGILFDRSGGTGSYYRFDLGRLQQLFIETHKITVNEGGENDGVEFLAD